MSRYRHVHLNNVYLSWKVRLENLEWKMQLSTLLRSIVSSNARFYLKFNKCIFRTSFLSHSCSLGELSAALHIMDLLSTRPITGSTFFTGVLQLKQASTKVVQLTVLWCRHCEIRRSCHLQVNVCTVQFFCV